MGKFAQVAIPVAAAIVAPYAAGALGAAGGFGAASGAAVGNLGIGTGLGTSAAASGFGSAAATVSPWAVATNAGLTGLSQLGALQQQRSQAAIARARNDAERARILRDYEIAERNRRSELKRSLAQQRARFGASGISSSGGSAGAVLQGLQKQTDNNSRDHLGSIRQQSASLNRINLLEESSARKRGQFQTFQKTIRPFVKLLED